ncbi:hypothetical protein EST38_g9234 [Candolleomyces aberdarensis]|uniref:AAA+ ATPase domain-containing protein n=1 Tax=Candolleomyces aberdarensis TaxID=2316362 RepID=A0A4Q2DB88_9AGAR|nr:hypothetical protein EST38_g9234 [Candolleomyces aberdarensis]
MESEQRAGRLSRLFKAGLNDKNKINAGNATLFLEAILSQEDRAHCLHQLSSPGGGDALQSAMRFTLTPTFFNQHASPLLHYFQQPELAQISSGQLLQSVLLKIVDPPIFWDAFQKAFLDGVLNLDGQKAFGWLLLQLVSLPLDTSAPYREEYFLNQNLPRLLSSGDIDLRALGQKIKHATEVLGSGLAVGADGSAPGGRHDNDFVDFRKIAIVPTPDEVQSKKDPFIRQSSFLQDPSNESVRVASHLDNQFRLLREDMLYELREEFKLAWGSRKGRRSTKVDNLKVVDLYLQDSQPRGRNIRRTKCGLQLQCNADLPIFKGVEPGKRESHIQGEKRLLKHQSLACLLSGNEPIAFVTLNRDTALLAKPDPIIVVQLEGNDELIMKTLRKVKASANLTIIQIDTALFAYEFVLKALQQARGLPLSEELLLWKPNNIPQEVETHEQAIPVVNALRADPYCDLKPLLQTKDRIKLDTSQSRSLLAGLVRRVSLIQGPPGTGKSFIGALMAKAIHDYTNQTILVVCFTNHALDDILTSLLDIGIPASNMVRLGFKSTPRTEPLLLQRQSNSASHREWQAIKKAEMMLDDLDEKLTSMFTEYMTKGFSPADVLEYLEFEATDYFLAFTVPENKDGMQTVGSKGRAVDRTYLVERWLKGWDAGSFSSSENVQLGSNIWNMNSATRKAKYQEWYDTLEMERVQDLCVTIKSYNQHFEDREQAIASKNIGLLREKRIIGCTTNAAAKYGFSIQAASPNVVLVEEAGEILESHILTALGPNLSQLILIGDHKQLRPKVNNYELTVEKGKGYNLNCSLFERLILSGYPHQTLKKQHRMRPEISDLIRQLTYPELRDAHQTQNRPNIAGVQDNIVFISHAQPEEIHDQISDKKDMASTTSKQNPFEVEMVLKIVKFLGQQGYGTDDLAVLTPYLGQLHRLRDALQKENDPLLNDLDSYELVRAGLLSPAIAKENKKPIRLSTVDNYQGEESNIIIISLTRSNPRNDIGFMFSPERLNVLLSRARNGLIMIGDSSTFKNSRNGGRLWTKLFRMLTEGRHIYEGLPVYCPRHPDRKQILCKAEDFDEKCPDGGCIEPCGAILKCQVHKCTDKCHNIADHSKIRCEEVISEKCRRSHRRTRKCYEPPAPGTCTACHREDKLARQKQLADLKEKERKEAAERKHLQELAIIDAEIEEEQRQKKIAREEGERAQAIRQRRADLAAARRADVPVGSMSTPRNVESPQTEPPQKPTSGILDMLTSFASGIYNNTSPQAPPVPSGGNQPPLASTQFKRKAPSPSESEWLRQKSAEGAFSPPIDEVMAMVGLESVKYQILATKAKINTCKRQNSSLAKERFNISFLGNPGTGKTTVARHYSTFLSSVGVIPGEKFVETTGSRLGYEGVQGAEKMLKKVLKAGGGTIFIDEAYQLTNGNNTSGPQVLDFLLTEMENNVGKIVFIVAGYNKEMETFFEHNPGLQSRVPYKIKFGDYSDEELMDMFENLILSTYSYQMQVEDGYRGLYSRVAIRRLGRRRSAPGFGNARDLQIFFAKVRERQAKRLSELRRDGKRPNDFLLTKEDLIGPDPSIAIKKSKAWGKLQGMIGLQSVKETVSNIVDSIQENYQRELDEVKPLAFSLNRVFLGPPGTGKTTVAGHYGQILADLGLLSKGEVVVKNPADFVGAVLGESEKKTKGILSNSIGKVLVIDEAYMLYGGGGDDSKDQNNQFKTSIIDTIVAEVQNVPGDDQCVLLLGYEKQMTAMFYNVNPGLARRFKVEEAFKFENFTDDELLQILELKLKDQDLGATDPAKKVAIGLLSRLRNRPNFGNGGEVENLLSKAKEQCLARRSKLPLNQRPRNMIFEPQDFDKGFDRAANAQQNLAKLFEDIVGHEGIVNKLADYQKIAQNCVELGGEPRERVPTNFVFTGPPGTGKTTIARKMGQVYYDMGVLASAEVIECSASDLVGQYVGHTGPKTRKLFKKALGKVIFIDEAYRLAEGHFAQEAVDELVTLLTDEAYKGKIIVILAGYDQDMKRLMTVNTGLSSRFPEWIAFHNMKPKDCINIVVKELKKEKVVVLELEDEESLEYYRMLSVIESLIKLPDWGNARDMVTLSAQIVRQALLSKIPSGSSLLLSGSDAVTCALDMLQQRYARAQVQPKVKKTSALPRMQNTPMPPTPPSTGVGTGTNTQQPNAPNISPPASRGRDRGAAPLSASTRGGRGSSPQQRRIVESGPPESPRRATPIAPSPASSSWALNPTPSNVQNTPGRDPGVSDEIWTQLEAARRRAEEEDRREWEKLNALHKRLEIAKREVEAHWRRTEELARQAAQAQEEARHQQLEEQRQQIEDRGRRLRAECERIAELERRARQAEYERNRKEQAVQQKLHQMGVEETRRKIAVVVLSQPGLAEIGGGQLLQSVLLKIVDPPIFWNPFQQAFLNDTLSLDCQKAFGWLLLQLISLSPDSSASYREDSKFDQHLSRLLSSDDRDLRSLGHKIKHAAEALNSDPSALAAGAAGSTPGGRHDNDFADFRQIAIVPTPDEVQSKEPPFLRPSDFLRDPSTEPTRVASHLDNQFRLLREDMLYELREELQLALGSQKRRRSTKISGLKVIGLYLAESQARGKNIRRAKCGLRLECSADLPIFKDVKPERRERYIRDERHFLRHQSLACLLSGDETIAFVTINRDTDLLAKPKPVIAVQLEGNEGLMKTLRKIKASAGLTLIQIDTALFAYEFVLKALQQARGLPLSEELLLWKDDSVLQELEISEQAIPVVNALRSDPYCDLKPLLQTKDSIQLDSSQSKSLLVGLVQRVSLIQGPPGTGKSFIGGLMAKAIHDYTNQTILVVCFTNHALDDILTSLLDIGIPASSMVRLGGKSTSKTEPLTLQRQGNTGYRRDKSEWQAIDGAKMMLDELDEKMTSMFTEYMSKKLTHTDILDHLEFEDSNYFFAFTVPKGNDGMQIVGGNGKAIERTYLLERWLKGDNAGRFSSYENVQLESGIWEMDKAARNAKHQEWYEALETERVQDLYATMKSYNRYFETLDEAFASKDISLLKEKRVIGCTTTAAAKYGFSIQAAAPNVVLVEEAGEILESHILTALGPKLSQLILIGDHKQLRPKVNNYELTVEKNNGYDLNCSLFERLILSDYPHETLTKQHRMRPEISDLIRQLTYPELQDAPKTQNRPNIAGVQNNIVFISHTHPEGNHNQLADKKDMASKASKQNQFEVDMVLKIVKYLGQQGYGTDNLVVLTPYLGQLHRLRDALKKDSDPLLNDLDSYELVKAGLLSPATARENKKPIRLSTIDNYQGEESDIVIISLTRSNPGNDIGFMYSPERLNVLLSRARNGLIMIGNSSTFKNSRKGKEIWTKLFNMLTEGKHIYEGLPVYCSRHPDRKQILCKAEDFDENCPEGGCIEPCGAMLNCQVHTCPARCHNIVDHSKIRCEELVSEKCPRGHPLTRKCHETPVPGACKICDREDKLTRKKQLADLKEKERKEAAERKHLQEMAEIDAEIEKEQRQKKEAKEAEERAQIIRQRRADLAAARAAVPVGSMSTPQNVETPQTEPPARPTSGILNKLTSFASGIYNNTSPQAQAQAVPSGGNQPSPASAQFNKKAPSPAESEWQRQKSLEGAFSPPIDEVMAMVGLESVKSQILAIKAKIDTCKRQNSSLAKERFNISFLGNPGTGKTTVARHYSTFLSSVGVIPGKEFVETTGSRLGYEGVQGAEKMLKDVLKAGGGTIFIDEAYQLTNGNNASGPQVLDFLLTEMENNVGKIVFIVAGYSKEMETFFEHNPGLQSRVPYKIKFDDYTDEELMDMFENLILSTYKYQMQVEDGYRGLYSRVAIRRLGRRRGAPGFGNARDLQIFFAKVRERQATRLNEERRDGKQPNDFLLTKEDLIGPDPSIAIKKSKAWGKLQGMIGLKSVKETVSNIVDSIQENYQRELDEVKPLAFSLNRVFLGPPGTGKTTVAGLYGQILADLSLLSKGEVVVKNPADFVGAVLGESEKKTKGILSNSIGKVLVIDEAYMLYGGGGDDSKNQNNQFKTSVIDTIVAEVQNVPGDDRCVLLLGYEKQMTAMFNNVNPGLARRFKVEEAFKFENFTDDELLKILELKLKDQDLGATDPAKNVAIGLLSRLRNRPNFGNGGEVENLLSKAKEQCLARRSKLPLDQRPRNMIFEPQDFDKDFDRAANAQQNLVKLFEDIVGHEGIVNKLADYQKIAQTCVELGREPRERVPTNFVFTGPPGTGKTTIARKMGQVYYDMGVLASAEVIECSASDLVGQYVGHTGPKTRKLFEKAVGKVIFIDEAYRLAEGHFAQEAVDELVTLLTDEAYKGKIIVILAGYDQDMQRLMTVNTGLSSRFPEWIAFPNMKPKDCINIVVKELKKEKVVVLELEDEESPEYSQMLSVIESLVKLPDWGNARDMVTLSAQIVRQALLSKIPSGTSLLLSGSDAVTCALDMLQQRYARAQVQPKVKKTSALPQMQNTPTPPTPPSTGVGTGTNTQQPNAPTAPNPPPPASRGRGRGAAPPNASTRGGRGGSQQQRRNVEPGPPESPRRATPVAPSPASSSRSLTPAPSNGQNTPGRDPGVSDEIWTQLQAARRQAEEEDRRKREELNALQQRLEKARREAEAQKRRAEELARQAAQEQDEARRKQLENQRRQAEENERRRKAERERIAELQRRAREAENERKRKEEAVQQKLRQMGVCVAGFQWISTGNGYRCAGGSHFVSSQQLGI